MRNAYLGKLALLRNKGSSQYRTDPNDAPSVVLDDPRSGFQTPRPKLDLLHPFEYLKADKAWREDRAAARANAIQTQRGVREHVMEKDAALAKTRSDHDQLRTDAAIADATTEAITVESVKDAIRTVKQGARVVFATEKRIAMLKGLRDAKARAGEIDPADLELFDYWVKSANRVGKASIDNLEALALGLDPDEFGGVS